MSSVNIGYVGYRLYEYLMGLNGTIETPSVQYSQIPHILNVVGWAGLCTAVVFFLTFVYLYFAAEHQTHAGLEAREAQEVLLMQVKEKEPRNDRWEQAITLANSLSPGDWRRAILEADILLHEMLIEKGFVGDDVGEQLRGASHAHFQTLDIAWEAHRIRNLIAHEGETFPLDQRQALATIDKYRQVFEEFGYI